MAYKRKTWAEKMNPKATFKVEKTDKDFADVPAGSKLLIATPAIVDEYVKNIPEGTATSLQQMRKDLAAEFHADYTCPVTSGIFVRIVCVQTRTEWYKPEQHAGLQQSFLTDKYVAPIDGDVFFRYKAQAVHMPASEAERWYAGFHAASPLPLPSGLW